MRFLSSLAKIEQLPHLPGGRWEREEHLLGFSETHLSAELAPRRNFPSEIVAALQASSDPLVSRPFNRLGAVVHLACLLAETPGASAETLDSRPQEVMSTLQLDLDWMKSHFPSAGSFFDIATL